MKNDWQDDILEAFHENAPERIIDIVCELRRRDCDVLVLKLVKAKGDWYWDTEGKDAFDVAVDIVKASR